MSIEKFVPLSPDPYLNEGADMTLARFGHLNGLVNTLNLNSDKKFDVVSYYSGSLSSGGSFKLSTDGSIVSTGFIIPDNNTVWAAEITVSAICNIAGGTVVLGNSFMGKFNVLIKRIGNVTSIVGVNSASTTYDASLATTTVSFTVGASNNFQINFNAPSTATNTGFKVTGVISVTQTTI
jgi:hypothetical protein